MGSATDGSTSGSGSIGVSGSGLSLEAMLLAKNRRLEHEMTMSRLAAAEGSQQLEVVKEQVWVVLELLASVVGGGGDVGGCSASKPLLAKGLDW
jgi:hypothetical protein